MQRLDTWPERLQRSRLRVDVSVIIQIDFYYNALTIDGFVHFVLFLYCVR